MRRQEPQVRIKQEAALYSSNKLSTVGIVNTTLFLMLWLLGTLTLRCKISRERPLVSLKLKKAKRL